MPDVDAVHWSARLADLAPRARVCGAVLGIWAYGQEILAAHGVLSTATGVAVTPESLFQIGSITKVWTATMIMQLVDEGALRLDSTVAQVLPGVRLGEADASADVTVRHLLTHTSGIDGDIFTDTGRGADCVERYVSGLERAALAYPPGQAYSYCNSGFVLLGRIIEILDGRTWDESLRARLTGPLGLSRTVTLPEEAILHRAATGHRARPRDDEPVPVWGLPRAVGPAGLITASAGDVLAFARLHLANGVTVGGARLLGGDSAVAMRQPQAEIPAIGGGEAIGLGWRLSRWDGRPVLGHDGSTVGQSAYLRIDPQARVAACLLTNASDGEALYRLLFSEVFPAFGGAAVPEPPGPADGPVDGDPARHAGRYERTSRRFDVTEAGGRLRVRVTVTGDLAAVRDAEPEEADLHPADSTGDHFVCRTSDDEPWMLVSFGRLASQAPYLYAGGRITPRVG